MAAKYEDEFPADVSKEMKIYERLLDNAISTKSSELLPNSDEYHAAVLITKLLQNTRSSIKMVVGSFDGNVSNKKIYQEAYKACLDNKVQVKILILEPPNPSSEILKISNECAKFNSDQITVYYANDLTRDILKKSFTTKGEIPHFSVYDDDKFRFEITPKTYSGWGSFNEKSYAAILTNVFESAMSVADHVNPYIS